MQPRSPLKVICMMIAACFLLASCSRNSDPAKVNVAQKKDVWSNAEVTRESVRLVLEQAGGAGVIAASQIKDIQVQGANNKTITVDLKHESPDPDQLMKDAAATLIAYSGILLENKGIGTVEVCLYGNPEPGNAKHAAKETVSVAVSREDLQKARDVFQAPVDDYAMLFKHASWYKIHPHLYKSLHYKDQLKTRAYLK
ncbi:hypothetical protein J2TS6_11990 [Paenibacillus albilobatus]|uniref:Uncharacterized protein n=2 Tax=Paenibacillus TaxID=44249 RepID=A0A920C9P5_9BACL|nr:hypothetical protein [Paenibacillus albilobatus]GIO30058.1 hypothetical protein J2TS6_11990 [Paenibacillus albilobatus]